MKEAESKIVFHDSLNVALSYFGQTDNCRLHDYIGYVFKAIAADTPKNEVYRVVASIRKAWFRKGYVCKVEILKTSNSSPADYSIDQRTLDTKFYVPAQ